MTVTVKVLIGLAILAFVAAVVVSRLLPPFGIPAESFSRASNNLALLESDLGEFASARAHYAETLEAFRSMDRPELEGRVLTNLGALHTDTGDPVAGAAALAFDGEAYRGFDAGSLSAEALDWAREHPQTHVSSSQAS